MSSMSLKQEKSTHGDCPVCGASYRDQIAYEVIQGLQYLECKQCGSLYADFEALKASSSKEVSYSDDYWQSEMSAAKARSFGSSLARCAEVFLYSRIPIHRFLDLGDVVRLSDSLACE